MPMDRPHLIVPLRGLGLIILSAALGSAGCRSTRSEVPPGKPYQTTGGAPPSVGFSNEPHPSTAAGMAALYGNGGPGALSRDGKGTASGDDLTFGTPTSGSSNLGAPTDNRFGPPGTAGSSDSSSGSAAVANSLLKAIPSGAKIVEKDMQTLPSAGPNSAGGGYP